MWLRLIIFFTPMPCKYHIRTFVEGGYYHIFNRGVEKRPICRDAEDYNAFLYFLESAVSLPDPNKRQRRMNFYDYITMQAFCLMPNHFHFLLQQKRNITIDKFMQSFIVAYTMYFNKKYKRVGSIFQGTYKAKQVTEDEYLLHVSRYIHENPRDIGQDPLTYPY